LPEGRRRILSSTSQDVFLPFPLASRDLFSPCGFWDDDSRTSLLDVIDWETNVDPDFHKNRFMAPRPIKPVEQMKAEGYTEEWIYYKCKDASTKRLTVLPGKTVTIKDTAAYGIICLQSFGKFGVWNMEPLTLIRYGQLTNDEFFVTEKAAKEGVTITNVSDIDEIVILKHFVDFGTASLDFLRIFCGFTAKNRAIRGSAIAPAPARSAAAASRPSYPLRPKGFAALWSAPFPSTKVNTGTLGRNPGF
jgi:hypothetical protein